MADPARKDTTKIPPGDNGKKQEPQQQADVPYHPEFLSSEEDMIRAEQQMSKLEVT